MARQTLRPTRRRAFRFLSCIVLLECCCTVVCQLQRTSDSSCGNIVCPGKGVEYECRVPNVGSANGVVWPLPECVPPGDQGLQIIRQGDGANTANRTCVGGTAVVMARGIVNGSFFISYLVINVTGQLETLTVECIFDNDTNTSSVGADTLTSTTAPSPLNLQQLRTSDSEIVVAWDEEPQFEGCSNLQYNFSHSHTCGTCVQADDHNIITCTGSEVGECILTVQTVVHVCGGVVSEGSTLRITVRDTTSPPTLSSGINTSTSDNPASLSSGELAAVIIVVIITFTCIIAGVIVSVVILVFRKRRLRQKQSLEKHPLNVSNISTEGRVNYSGDEVNGPTNEDIDQGDNDEQNNELKNTVEVSVPEHSSRSHEHVDLEVSRLPPVNGSALTNDNGEDGVTEANIGDSAEDQTGHQMNETIKAGSGASDRRQAGGMGEHGSATGRTNSESSPGICDSSSATDEVGAGDKDERDPGDHVNDGESSQDVDSGSQNVCQESSTQSAIEETSQVPHSRDPVVGVGTSSGVISFPNTQLQRTTEPRHFHAPPPSEESYPAQQESAGRPYGNTGNMKTSDVAVLFSEINLKLEDITEIKRELKELKKEISKKDRRITNLETEMSELRSQLEQERDKHSQELRNLKSQLEQKQNEVNVLSREKRELEEQLRVKEAIDK